MLFLIYQIRMHHRRLISTLPPSLFR